MALHFCMELTHWHIIIYRWFWEAANRRIIQQRKLKLNAAIQGDVSTLVEKDLTTSSLLFDDKLTPTWVKDQKKNNMVDDYLFDKAKEPDRKKQKEDPRKSYLKEYSQNQSDQPSSLNSRKDKYLVKQHKSKYKDQKNKRAIH